MTKSKLKILLITLRSDLGGAPLQVDNIITGLASGIDFYCASPLDKPYGIKWKNTLGNHFLELPHRKFKITALFNLLKFIRKNKIKIIHSHGKGAGVYSRMAKLFLPRLIVVHTFHGLHLPQNYLSRKLYLVYESVFTHFTNELINVSPSEKNNFIVNGILKSESSKIVRNGIEDLSLMKTGKKNLRLKLNLPLDKVILISVARLTYQKNIEELLYVAEIFLSYGNCLFIVIGGGEERDKLKEIKNERKINNVLLLGPKENVNDYLNASDIYITTSRWEGLPYSLREAARAALPIIGSNVTGNTEVIKNNTNGYLYEPGNIVQLKKYITKLLDDKRIIKRFGEESRKIFESEFLLQKMLDEIENIYFSHT